MKTIIRKSVIAASLLLSLTAAASIPKPKAVPYTTAL